MLRTLLPLCLTFMNIYTVLKNTAYPFSSVKYNPFTPRNLTQGIPNPGDPTVGPQAFHSDNTPNQKKASLSHLMGTPLVSFLK